MSLVKSSSSKLSSNPSDLMSINVENLESLCLTKKRLLESLKPQTESLSEEYIHDQLQRDIIINTLNKRILSLKYKILEKSRSTKETLAKKQISAAKIKISLENKEKLKVQDRIKYLQEELAKKSKVSQNDFAKINEKLRDISDMNEMYSDEFQEKSKKLTEVLQDLSDLQKIYKNMSEIHQSIENKMDTKRTEVSDLLNKHREYVLGTESIEKLDILYTEVFRSNSLLAAEKNKLKKKFGKNKVVLKLIENYPMKIQSLLNHLQELTGFIEEVIDESEIKRILNAAKSEIDSLMEIHQIHLPKPIKFLLPAEEKSRFIQNQFVESEKHLQRLKDNLKSLESSETASSLFTSLQKFSQSEAKNKNLLEKQKSDLISYQEKCKAAKEKVENSMRESQQLDIEFHKYKSKTESAASKLALLQATRKDDLSKQEELKAEISVLSKKLNAKKDNSLSSDANGSERKLNNIVTQVTTLNEEIMKKDTQIIKRIREVISVEEAIKRTQENLDTFDEKAKATKTELYSRFDEIIDKKDKEIGMLKEILRGNASEIRSKEMALLGIKKKIDQISLVDHK